MHVKILLKNLFIASQLSLTLSLRVRHLSMTNTEKKVGFIGLGIMGYEMAQRILTINSNLCVWNRSKEKCEELKKKYDSISIAATPKEVLQQCELTFVMLSTPVACREVYKGENGILAGVSAGTYIVDCATLRPENMISIANEVISRGGKFLEAPVSGSKVPAQNGQLIFMTAGDESLSTSIAKPYLDVMGKATYFLSPNVGAATNMKLVVNSVMGNMLACLSEGMHLSEAAGLPNDALLSIISQGAIANPMFALKGPKMIAGDHSPNFPLKHACKDIIFADSLASSLGVDSSMSKTAIKKYEAAIGKGYADMDFSAVHEAQNSSDKQNDLNTDNLTRISDSYKF